LGGAQDLGIAKNLGSEKVVINGLKGVFPRFFGMTKLASWLLYTKKVFEASQNWRRK
jgi:hypothetical protein